jgi:hypothetical protein
MNGSRHAGRIGSRETECALPMRALWNRPASTAARAFNQALAGTICGNAFITTKHSEEAAERGRRELHR